MLLFNVDIDAYGFQNIGTAAAAGDRTVPVLGHDHPGPATTSAVIVEILKVFFCHRRSRRYPEWPCVWS